jgi:pyridoxamine 5'-phosphate oxidase
MESSEPQETAAGQVRGERMLVPLDEREVDANPFVQFERWLQEAVAAGAYEPTAMALATATPDGRPSVRMVLLKGVDAQGFVFYSNYESQKGRELAENPRAALLFHWAEPGRQVRVTGAVERVPTEESAGYFTSRSRGSRLGALASRQSTVLPNRESLDQLVDQLTREHEGRDIPLPAYWGGYRLAPDSFEFWQSRPNRLHDRLRYPLQGGGRWLIERLAP